MKVRLWINEDYEIKLVEVTSVKQVDKDVCITIADGTRYYIKNDYYSHVFEEAEKLGYIKSVVKTLD